jgi:hypothetical protein
MHTTTPRLVVAGRISPGRAILNVAPDFDTDDAWRELISTVAEATPVEAGTERAYRLGTEDAQRDIYFPPRPCSNAEFEAYLTGWQAGHETTQDTQEYMDDRDDREYHARGQW